MEFAATQIYEDDELLPTQKIPCTEEDESVQVNIHYIFNRFFLITL